MAFSFLWYLFLVPEIFKFSYSANLATDDVIGLCKYGGDTKLRISPPIMKQCYWNLAGMFHPKKYTRWYTFLCCYGNMLGSSLLLLQNEIITICDSTRQNTWSYLRHMPVPPSLGLLFNIFNCIFCPMQLQMVKFDFKEEGTGPEHQIVHHLVYFLGCNIPAKFQ